MASDIMQQVQEDSRKKKQQGVLSRLSSTAPRSAGVGGYGTPEPTVVEKAKEVQEEEVVAEPEYKQSAKRLAADLREDGTTTESWEAAKQEVADRGARYREALQSPDAWKRDIDASRMAEFGDVGDVVGAKDSGFEEQYDADVKFQEEEYGKGTGSLERNRLVAEIAGYDYVDKKGKKQRARGEDDKLYSQKYSEVKEENPDATEEELQDAALKAVMAYRAREAELDIDKILRESEVEATEDVGADLEREKTLAQREAEEAERLKKEKAGVVTSAVERLKETGPGWAYTRRQPTAAELAAKKALSYDSETGTFSRDGRAIPQAKVIEETATPAATPAATPKQNATVSLLESYSPRQQQAVLQQPGGANFIEALNSLDAASKGDVSALMRFEEAFGDRAVQGGKDTSRRQFLSRIPPMLRDSFGDSLREAVSASEPKVSKGLESQLSRNLYESVSSLEGVPSDEEQAEIDKTAKELQEVFLNHSKMTGTASMTGGVRKQIGLDSVGEAKRVELVNNLMEKIGIRKGILESLGASPSLARPSDVFANNPELRNQVLAFNQASDLLNTSNFIPAAEGTSALAPARTSGAIPQEALDKYPVFEDTDDDFTGLTVSADYGDQVDIPEGKEFSYTIFPRNYTDLPLGQQYEYVVMTDGTKYLYTDDPEDPENYLDPVKVSEIAELSPSESIIESAAGEQEG